LRQMYQSPIVAAQQEGHKVDDELIAQAQEHLDHFYEEVWTELARYGKIEDMQIIDNLTEHMVGTVYVRFSNDGEASEAIKKLSGRFYGGKLIQCELSHITDFQDARCRQFDEGTCTRGLHCNFIHWKGINNKLKKKLIKHQKKDGDDSVEKKKKKKKSKKSKKSKKIQTTF